MEDRASGKSEHIGLAGNRCEDLEMGPKIGTAEASAGPLAPLGRSPAQFKLSTLGWAPCSASPCSMEFSKSGVTRLCRAFVPIRNVFSCKEGNTKEWWLQQAGTNFPYRLQGRLSRAVQQCHPETTVSSALPSWTHWLLSMV